MLRRPSGGAPRLGVDSPHERPCVESPRRAPADAATREQVEAALDDPKLANVLYHDWEAATYDEKWSISYDERCIDYARDRFAHVRGQRRLALRHGARARLRHRLLPAQPDAGRRARRGPRDRPVARHGQGRGAQRRGARLRASRAGSPTPSRIPYDDDTFDLVVGHAVLHHIPDVELAMREVLRVLKPGGRFVFAGEPTEKGDWVARRLSRAHLVGGDEGHAPAAAAESGRGRRRSSTSRRAPRRWSRSSTSTRSTPTAWPRWRCGPARSTCGPSPRSSPRRGSAGRCARSRPRCRPGRSAGTGRCSPTRAGCGCRGSTRTC